MNKPGQNNFAQGVPPPIEQPIANDNNPFDHDYAPPAYERHTHERPSYEHPGYESPKAKEYSPDNPPPEINGLNWGAFFLTAIWLICMNPLWGIVTLIAILFANGILRFVVFNVILKDFLASAMANPSCSDALVIWLIAIMMNLVIPIFLLIVGNRLAWKLRRFKSVAEFHEVQESWARWGGAIFIGAILLTTAQIIFPPSFYALAIIYIIFLFMRWRSGKM